MKKSSPTIKCDSYTYSSTLKACADTRNLKVGKAVHCHILRGLWNPSRIVYNSLLNMYSACQNNFDHSEHDLVRKLFLNMPKRNVVAWNTLVSWYVKTERYEEAVKQFVLMMKARIKPSAVSFVNVFPALSGISDSRVSNVIYGLLIRMGCDYVNDLFVVSSAICMFAELGCLDLARKVFDVCFEKNTEVWNTMIGAYVQNNLQAEAIHLFSEAMESEDADLDEVSFLSAFTAVPQLQDLKLAQQLHAYAMKHLQIMPIFIKNAIIVMYSRCNCIDIAFKLFHEMLERDVVTWNTIISAFVQNEFDDEAIMLVYEMQKQGYSIDYVTVTALLSAASNLRNPHIGKQTHAYLIRHEIQFEGMDGYLIDMYSKSGLVRNSEQLFKKNYNNSRDLATWNSMIAGYTQNGLSDEAFVVFRLMLEQNIAPNAVTLASILPACCLRGSIHLGKQIHGFSIRHYLDLNVFVGTALIDMYSKSGAITYAENVFVKANEKNSVSYTTMILGYGRHGMGEKALSLFHAMQDYGIEPDAITFIAILSACSYSGLVDTGLQIFDSMKIEHNIQPLTAHHCCVADMLGRVGRVVEAYEFVKELGEEGNVLEIWGSLLGACKIHRQFELGKIVAEKLLEMEKRDGITGYHVLLSNMYADEGKWDTIDKVRKQMREKGLKKETGCSWIDISGYVSSFVSKDQKHFQCTEIYDMLRNLAFEMEATGYRPSTNFNFDGVIESD